MKIRPQTFMAGISGKATPMNKLGAKGFYIQSVGGRYWVHRKAVIPANLPYTIESPHLGQIEVRTEFGKIAASTAGMPLMERLDTIAKEMRGYKAPHAMNPANYPSKRKGYHTLSQLEAMLQKKLGKTGEYGAYRAGEYFRGPGL